MSVAKAFRRTSREFPTGGYGGGGNWMYILHTKFAREPEHYVRAFALIQKDLHEIHDYVEPADINQDCFSYRIHALHMRACIEVEANCKAILAENGYVKPPKKGKSKTTPDDWNMDDYKKLDRTHRLSQYEIRLPVWRGSENTRQPFAAWKTDKGLAWYQAYNAAKHDRHDQFREASLRNLVDAISGLIALLSSQFYTWDFPPSEPTMAASGIGGPPQGFEGAIGGYFQVKFPKWPAAEQYDFDWASMQNATDPFQSLTF